MTTIETNLSANLIAAFERVARGSYGVTIGKRSGDDTVSVPYPALADWAPESILRVWEYGCQRFVNDRIGGSDTTVAQKAEAARALMERIVSGDWERRAASAVEPIVAKRRIVVANMVKAKVGDTAWKDEYADAEDLGNILDVIYDKQSEAARAAIDVKAEALLEADRIRREATRGDIGEELAL